MGNQHLYDIMKEKDAIYAKEDFSDEDGIRAGELEGEFADQLSTLLFWKSLNSMRTTAWMWYI